MAVHVNGSAIMAAIAEIPSAFGMDESEVNALAMSRVLARLKTKALTLDQLRTLLQAIGGDDFRLALDHISGKDAAVLVKRLDPKNPDLRGSDEAWQRSRIVALADGAEPKTGRPARPVKIEPASHPGEARTGGAKTGAVMKSRALKARPKKDEL